MWEPDTNKQTVFVDIDIDIHIYIQATRFRYYIDIFEHHLRTHDTLSRANNVPCVYLR